jgi:hypothetical protein
MLNENKNKNIRRGKILWKEQQICYDSQTDFCESVLFHQESHQNVNQQTQMSTYALTRIPIRPDPHPERAVAYHWHGLELEERDPSSFRPEGWEKPQSECSTQCTWQKTNSYQADSKVKKKKKKKKNPYLIPKVRHHRRDGQRETHDLNGVQSVPVEHEGEDQGEHLADQADQSAVQRAKLGDCHEHKDLWGKKL